MTIDLKTVSSQQNSTFSKNFEQCVKIQTCFAGHVTTWSVRVQGRVDTSDLKFEDFFRENCENNLFSFVYRSRHEYKYFLREINVMGNLQCNFIRIISWNHYALTQLIYLFSHSVEKTSYLLSQFFAKFAEKFRQIETYRPLALIYSVKYLQKNRNYVFLRKFAQEISITSNRGGYWLILSVESLADHCRPWE